MSHDMPHMHTVGDLLNEYVMLESRLEESQRKIAELTGRLQGNEATPDVLDRADIIFMMRNEPSKFFKVLLEHGLYSTAEEYADVVRDIQVWETTGWRVQSIEVLEKTYVMSGEFWKPFFLRELRPDQFRS